MEKRKIIPITDAPDAREQLELFSDIPEEESPGVGKPPGELPLAVRARLTPALPAALVIVGALLVAAGLIDGIPLVWIPGGLILLAGIRWLLLQRHLYRFTLRSGGSSPRHSDNTEKSDQFNDSIVTRG